MHDKYNVNERHDEAIITQSKLRPNATPTKIWLAELQIDVLKSSIMSISEESYIRE